MKRVIVPRPGSFRSRQPLTDERGSTGSGAVVGGADPALHNPPVISPNWKPMLICERNILVCAGASLVDAAGENRVHANVSKRIGKRVGMTELPAVSKCAIGSSSGLVGIAAMPEPTTNSRGEFATLVRLVQ
jgi:hypothetical protein